MKLHSTTPKRKASITVDGESVTFEFHSPTLAMLRAADSRAAELRESNLPHRLAAMLTAWDVEADNGEPAPITPDALQSLPVDVLRAIHDAAFDAVRPGPNALRDMRRWYRQAGKMGQPIDDHDIYALAIDHFKCNPAELRTWDLYDLERVILIVQARTEARNDALSELPGGKK